MGVIQEKRHNAPMPKIDERDYGAKVITASVESPAEVVEPVVAEPVVQSETVESAAAVEVDAHDNAEASADAVQEVSDKKKAGRPRKSDKKK